jgi:hypothetical protein
MILEGVSKEKTLNREISFFEDTHFRYYVASEIIFEYIEYEQNRSLDPDISYAPAEVFFHNNFNLN